MIAMKRTLQESEVKMKQKKIVSMLLVAALCATSLFAIDLSVVSYSYKFTVLHIKNSVKYAEVFLMEV